MKISELYGKIVESTAGKRGYVFSVNANGSRLECLVCADEEENEFKIDIKNIVSIGEKIVFEDRDSAMAQSVPVRLGRAGYDEQGNFLGTLKDCTFKKSKLLWVRIGKKNYPADGVLIGDAVLVKNLRKLNSDVVSDGKIIIKKGTAVTDEVMQSAIESGEFVQTNLKSL